ncbi:hypothetical protein [Variovorax sp. 350MFTsu5.1]
MTRSSRRRLFIKLLAMGMRFGFGLGALSASFVALLVVRLLGLA